MRKCINDQNVICETAEISKNYVLYYKANWGDRLSDLLPTITLLEQTNLSTIFLSVDIESFAITAER